MIYPNNPTLWGYLWKGGHRLLALCPVFWLNRGTLLEATREVNQQHPELARPRARAAYRMLTRRKVSTDSLWRWACAIWGLLVLALLLTGKAHAQTSVNIDRVGGTKQSSANVVDAGNTAFRVNCVAGCVAGGSFGDNAAFTFGSTAIGPIGAVVDDTSTNLVTENSAGAPRMSTRRILYTFIRKPDDTANLGDTTNPLVVNCNAGCGGAGAFVDNAAFTFGTSTVGNIGFVVDDTATNAVTENSAGAPRMSAQRIAYASIHDDAGAAIAPATSGNQSTQITSLQLIDDMVHSMNAALNKAAAIAGQMDDASTTAATEDNVAPLRITAQRAAHVNLRNNAGTEIGTAGAPLRVDPTGSTIQPVSGTVTANQGGAPWSSNTTQLGGNAIDTNSGNKSAGTQRVVIATDQPNLTSALNVNCTAGCSGSSFADNAAFTFGTTTVQPIAGVLDDVAPNAATENSAAAVRITSDRMLFTNLGKVGGTATDTNSGNKSAGTLRVVLATDQPQLTNALKVDGSAVTQPVSGTVTVTQGTGTNLHIVCDSGCTPGGSFADNTTFTFGTTAINVAGYVFDDVAPNAVTEDNAAAPRMSSKRVAYSQIRDAAGNERGANVNASNQLSVSVDNTPTVTANAGTNLNTSLLALESGGNLATVAGAVRAEDAASADGHTGIGALAVRKAAPANTSGTDGDYEFFQISAGRLWVSATIDAALPTGANVIGALTANQSVNVAQINGVAPSMGNGGAGAGTQRVTIANDSSGQINIASMPNEGQQTMANSISVAVASDQSAIAVSGPLTDTQLRATPVPVSGSGNFTVVQGTGTNLHVVCDGGTCGGASPFADNSAFTFGTSGVGNVGFVVDDVSTNAVAENSAGAPRMNAKRIIYAGAGLRSSANSSTATLTGGSVFTGTFEEVSDFAGLTVGAFADVASATNGLCFEWSSDGANADRSECSTLSAASGRFFNISTRGRYFRTKFTNGTTGQATFRLETVYCSHCSGTITKPLKDATNTDNFAQTVQATLLGLGPDGATYQMLTARNQNPDAQDWGLVVRDPNTARLVSSINGGFASLGVIRGTFNRPVKSTGDALDVNVKYPPASFDPCGGPNKGNVPISTSANVRLIVGQGTPIRICSIALFNTTAQSFSLVEGTGATCATGVTAVIGSTTAANGPALAALGGYAQGSGSNWIASTKTPGNDVCILISGSTLISGNLTYAF